MQVIRKYTHGGSHPDEKLQTALDTIQYTGEKGEKKYDVNTLLDVLRFTNTPDEQTVMDDIFSVTSPEERKKQFKSFIDKQGGIRVTSLDEGSGKYNPVTTIRGMSDEELSKLAGRSLGGSEARDFRNLLMEDPAFVDYFIGIQEEEPKRRDFRKVNIAKNVGKKSQNIGAGTTGKEGSWGKRGAKWQKVCDADGCKLVRQGRAGY
jgi:hypothetical protein